jgi:hypothetical protein
MDLRDVAFLFVKFGDKPVEMRFCVVGFEDLGRVSEVVVKKSEGVAEKDGWVFHKKGLNWEEVRGDNSW